MLEPKAVLPFSIANNFSKYTPIHAWAYILG